MEFYRISHLLRNRLKQLAHNVLDKEMSATKLLISNVIELAKDNP